MTFAVCVVGVLLAPFAAAGLALIQQGLGRSRSAAHAMLGTLCVLAVSAIVFYVVGASVAGVAGGRSISLGRWDVAGALPLFGGGVRFDGAVGGLALCLQMFAVGLAGMIAVSAGTDRWRLAAICGSSVFFAGVVYPVFAHWVWGGGWLARLRPEFGLPGFADAGGVGAIHVTGGLMALSVAWIVGPRRGKYSQDGMPAAIPGHNIVLVLFGCQLALVGWIGLDGAAAVLFGEVGVERMPAIAISEMLAASAGCLAALATTQVRYRKPDASLCANGWVAGLVAGSAGCAAMAPGWAIPTGAVAGVIVVLLAEAFELRLGVDDPGGAIPVHAAAGVWGLLAAGMFGPVVVGTRGGQMLSQVVGVATLLGCMFPLIHVANLVLNRLVRYRVDRDGDWQGMDIRELGAGAYPEFVVHTDEFVPR